LLLEGVDIVLHGSPEFLSVRHHCIVQRLPSSWPESDRA
jgi:hypothetical protein